jgi:hypothetical protein
VSSIVKGVAGGLLALGGQQLIGAGVRAGGPGGTAAAAAGGVGMIAGGAAIAGPLGAIVGSLAAVVTTQQEVAGMNSQIASDIHATSNAYLAQAPNQAALLSSLSAIDDGIRDISSNPLMVAVSGDALDHLRAMRDQTAQQIVNQNSIGERAENRAAMIAFYQKQAASAAYKDAQALRGLNATQRAIGSRQLAKADRIIASNHSNRQKLAELASIERALKDARMPDVAARIRAKINELKAAMRVTLYVSMTMRTGTGTMTTAAHPISSATSPGPGKQGGGYVPAGWTGWVGEGGPELAHFPGPATIIPNERTDAFLSNSRARQLIAHVTINATFNIPPVRARIDPGQAASAIARYEMTIKGAAATTPA